MRLVSLHKLGKDLALDLAAEQRADAGAGEAEPELIDKIRRQHESIAERMANFGRIDVGALRRQAGPAFLVPVVENGSRGWMFHGATCSVAGR